MVFKRRIRTPGGGSTITDRRRTERRLAGWDSRFLIAPADGERELVYVTDSDYSDCTLRDLTTVGAGLRGHGAELSVGDRIVLDLQLGARHRASIKVTGEVRHAAASDDGSWNAGIEFTAVGNLERALLARLVRDLEQPAPQPV